MIILFSYLNWASDQKYLHMINDTKLFVKKVWRRYTLFEIREDAECMRHRVNGVLHRDDDLPAVVYRNGNKSWYRNGKLCRGGDKPAIESTEETGIRKAWFKHGNVHRSNDLPAIEYGIGTLAWYKNGKVHRDGDLPAIVDNFHKRKEWYVNDERHRDNDLPAIEWENGDKEWYRNGKHHRDNDLPAVICVTGTRKWFINGVLQRRQLKRNNE